MTKGRKAVVALFFVLTLITGIVAGQALADQPRMMQALDALRVARTNLQEASTDKGGHRERALELVNRAISEVEKGVQYDRRH